MLATRSHFGDLFALGASQLLPLPQSGISLMLLVALAIGYRPAVGLAQDVAPPTPEDWAVHAQATFVAQYHPAYAALYSGPNSLTPKNQARETFDITLYGGVRPWQGGELWVNPEVDQGFGLNSTLGVAGFPSGEAYKIGSSDPYVRIPRVFLRQTFDLGGEMQHVDPASNNLAADHSADRIVITAGKFSVTDIFDTNSYAHDPRSDFLNWSVIDAGNFDYAADAWGYTYGAAAEWYQDWWTIRSGLFNLSRVPNSKALDTRAFDQYQWAEELEERHQLLGQPGKLKLLGFLSHGHMGAYAAATELASQTGSPADITAVRKLHNRGGFSLNAEQQVTDALGVFARAGWSQGQYEAFEFTDIDKTASLGLSLKGKDWGRADDTLGLALATNDASKAAKQFFAAGGLGILAGDGQLLRSGPEKIVEVFYDFAVFDVAKLTLDYQFIDNPAYNRDRGPVSVFAVRAHIER